MISTLSSQALLTTLQRDGRRVHLESNGTIFTELPDDVWRCVSPKERVDRRMARRAKRPITGRTGAGAADRPGAR